MLPLVYTYFLNAYRKPFTKQIENKLKTIKRTLTKQHAHKPVTK